MTRNELLIKRYRTLCSRLRAASRRGSGDEGAWVGLTGCWVAGSCCGPAVALVRRGIAGLLVVDLGDCFPLLLLSNPVLPVIVGFTSALAVPAWVCVPANEIPT